MNPKDCVHVNDPQYSIYKDCNSSNKVHLTLALPGTTVTLCQIQIKPSGIRKLAKQAIHDFVCESCLNEAYKQESNARKIGRVN